MLLQGGYAVISGIVGRDSTAPVFEVENLDGEYTAVEPDSGAWRLDWWDVSETQLLKTMWFDPVFERREGLLDYANFFIVTSRPEDAAIVTLSIGDYEVTRIMQTSSAPTVSLLYPTGGESLQDSAAISWTASDADNDSLRFDVFANRDGGNWEPIAMGVTDTFVMWHVAYFPGTNAGRVKVVVSDGWNSSADSSDGMFSVAFHSPEATIESPQDTDTILATSYITLSGRGTDIEDGNIPSDSLQWYRYAEFVGTGSLLQVGNLEPGLQTFLLFALDSDGQVGMDTVYVQVLTDGDQDNMADDWEVEHGLDATRNDAYADSDFDGLSNGQEYSLQTAPDSTDTDSDTYSDGEEVARSSDPRDAGSVPTTTWIDSPVGDWGLLPNGWIGFGDPLNFSWNLCSADDSLDPLRYEVHMDADPNFSNPLIAYADTLTNATGTWPLAIGMQYSWKVKVSDIYGHWIWSPVAYVTRGSNPQMPTQIDSLICMVQDNSLLLHWSPVNQDTSGNPITVVQYLIYAAAGSDGPYGFIASSTSTMWIDSEAFELEWPTWFYRVVATSDYATPPLLDRHAWPYLPASIHQTNPK
ncbi:hypothetical protein KKH27_02595 [bacterium]|nr:hypothetical protein [bacterium]